MNEGLSIKPDPGYVGQYGDLALSRLSPAVPINETLIKIEGVLTDTESLAAMPKISPFKIY